MNTVERVVAEGNCCGCGVCAGVCPTQALAMVWSEGGDLISERREGCADCGLCLKVCPFAGPGARIDGLARGLFGTGEGVGQHADVGYHRGAWVGYSTTGKQREQGSSGGLVTWLLETLLETGEVDGVVAVTEAQRPGDRLFGYRVLRSTAEVRQAAGSRYYPVELSGAVREILAAGGGERFAVVALPCRAYGLRLAALEVPGLAERLRCLVGLTCGQLLSRCYTEYLAALGGIAPGDLGQVDYRVKAGTERAGNFRFVATCAEGGRRAEAPYHPLQHRLCRRGYFTCRACLYCDDVFAETADVVAMDAWLPPYEADPRGTSLLVTRDARLHALVAERAAAGQGCHLAPIAVEQVALSQAAPIRHKRRELPGRLWSAHRHGEIVPPRRVLPDEGAYRTRRRRIELEAAILRESKQVWAAARVAGDAGQLRRAMARLDRAMDGVERLQGLARLWPRVRDRILKTLRPARGEGSRGSRGDM